MASLHFRNQLRILKDEYYEQFCELASSTWHGLKVERLDLPTVMDTEAREKKVHLTVWGAKELENYIISPAPIQRILEKKGVSLTVDEVTTAIRKQTEVLRQETEDSVSQFIRLENRKLGADKTNPMARKYVQERVEKVGLEMVVNGKKLFSGVISAIQGQHKVSFSLNQVLNETKPDEVHPDIVSFMKAIEAQ